MISLTSSKSVIVKVKVVYKIPVQCTCYSDFFNIFVSHLLTFLVAKYYVVILVLMRLISVCHAVFCLYMPSRAFRRASACYICMFPCSNVLSLSFL